MRQTIIKKEEVDVGEEAVFEQVKVNQLSESGELQSKFFDVQVVNDSSAGDLKIIIGEKTGRTHALMIVGGRINLMRCVKNMDSTKLNKPSEVEWLKEDGKWGPEPVKNKRVNAPFEFHLRDIKAQ